MTDVSSIGGHVPGDMEATRYVYREVKDSDESQPPDQELPWELVTVKQLDRGSSFAGSYRQTVYVWRVPAVYIELQEARQDLRKRELHQQLCGRLMAVLAMHIKYPKMAPLHEALESELGHFRPDEALQLGEGFVNGLLSHLSHELKRGCPEDEVVEQIFRRYILKKPKSAEPARTDEKNNEVQQ